jgi:hypothetical protein
MGVMTGRATLSLGLASLASALFTFVHGAFQFVWLPSTGAVIALVLGAVTCLAGWLDNRLLTLVCGAAFLAAAVVLMVLLVRGGFLIGNGSAFSLWLGLGVGLVVLGLSPADRRTT